MTAAVTHYKGRVVCHQADDCKRERKLLQASLTSDELIKFDEEGDDPSLTRSHSSQSLTAKDQTEGETKSLLSETGSVDSADKFSGIPCLSEVMQKAITGEWCLLSLFFFPLGGVSSVLLANSHHVHLPAVMGFQSLPVSTSLYQSPLQVVPFYAIFVSQL